MMTDPIADMLTRLRNALAIERPYVDMPATRLKVAIATALLEEGFIRGYKTGTYTKTASEHGSETEFREAEKADGPNAVLRLFLKTGPESEEVIRSLKRFKPEGFKPRQRVRQVTPDAIRNVLRGLKSPAIDRGEKAGEGGGESHAPGGDGDVVLEIEIPEDVPDTDVVRHVAGLIEDMSRLHRARGGHGLKITKLDVQTESPVGVPQ